ncbi:MAG: tetratricopeptide repeat protein, partial [Bacteroidota bacterium]
LSVQQKDFEMALRQAKALDRRLDQQGRLVLEVAMLSASNDQYSVAAQSYEYVIGLGDLTPYYLDAKVGLLNVKFKQATSGYEIDYDLLRNVEAEYENTIQTLGLNNQTVSLVRNLANLKAFYLNNIEEAAQMLQSVIDLSNISNRVRGECRVELADILLLRGDLWDAHLLYAQVDKTFRDDPLAHEARYKNARLSFYMGEFKWAKAQLDVLKSATSRLTANDAMKLSLLIQDNLEEDGTSVPLTMLARAEMHEFMHNYDMALEVLDSLESEFASHQILDDVLMTRARIFMRTGEYQSADETLLAIVTQFADGLHAPEALFLRAMLYEQVFQDKQKAMDLYTDLMVNYPGSLRNADARSRFRYLRGDLNKEDLFFYDIPF